VHMQTRDVLTGLPTRDLLQSVKTVFNNRDNESSWTFAMIDIDHFKLINDIHGHLTGDRVLVEVVDILSTNLRKSDYLMRFGGDEFLGVFPDTKTDDVLNYAERVMAELRNRQESSKLKTTISIGLAESRSDETDIFAMIDQADKALYNAKECGRSRIYFYSGEQSVNQTDSIRLNHFVGRQSELNNLRQLLDQSISEGTRFALLEGEAGVGKSRLASEIVYYATFRDCIVMHGECFEFGDSEPYSFLLKPVREYLDKLPTDDVKKLESSLEPFHPATAELFSEYSFPISEDLQFFREERLKYRLFEDFTRLFRSISKWSPILFIVDDVQWMTTPDIDLFKYLVRSVQNDHFMFVVTMRSMERTSADIRQHLLSLRRSIALLHVKLDNLEKQETFNLIMFALKDPNVPQEVLETIYRHSGGNPFFLEELINSLIQSGSIRRNASGDWCYHVSSELKLPESLAQLISSRLYPLTSISRNYLRIAALFTGSFSADVICAVTNDDPLKVMQGLEEPVRMGLLQCVSTEECDLYRFTHDTICSFLHRELSAVIKKAYHRQIAEYLENTVESGKGDDRTISMAYHYVESGDRDKAAWSALQAAKIYEQRQANRETARWLERYLNNTDESDDNREERFNVLVRLGTLYTMFGDFERALAYFDKADELSENTNERSHVTLKRGQVFQNISNYDEARTCYKRACKSASSDLKQVEALNALAFLDYLSGDLPASLDSIQKAVSKLETVSADQGILEKHQASLTTTKGVVKCAIMPGDDAVSEYEKALALYKKHGDLAGQATIYNNLSDVYSRTGHYEKAMEALKHAETINLRLDDTLSLAIALYNTAILYMEINQPVQAKEYFQRYADISREIRNELGLAYTNLGAGELYEEEGSYDKADESFRKAVDIFEKLGVDSMALSARLVLIHVLILKGDLDQADIELESVMGIRREILEKDLMSDIFYVQGLLKLKRYQKGDKNQVLLNDAESLVKHSLEVGYQLDVSFLMRRYYHLVVIQRLQQRTDDAEKTLKTAQVVLRERLGNIKKSHIRDNISKKRYVRDIKKGM
jgi:diguanylate cyclase (GGDEF)-like protein